MASNPTTATASVTVPYTSGSRGLMPKSSLPSRLAAPNVTASPAAYQQLYDQTLARLPGVKGLRSTLLMKQVVPLRPLPTHAR